MREDWGASRVGADWSPSEIVEALMDGPIEATDYVMRQVLGDGFVPLRVPLPPERMPMDDGRRTKRRGASRSGAAVDTAESCPDPARCTSPFGRTAAPFRRRARCLILECDGASVRLSLGSGSRVQKERRAPARR